MQRELSDDFVDFKTEHWMELEPNAMYEVLAKLHKEEDWTKWPEEHKYLYDKPEYGLEKEDLILKKHLLLYCFELKYNCMYIYLLSPSEDSYGK